MRQTRSGHLTSWLEALSSWEKGHDLRHPNFVKPFHLVTLALAARRGGRGAAVQLPPGDLENYAARMHLWEAAGVNPPVEVNKHDPRGYFLPAQPLHNQGRVLEVADKLVEIAPKATDASSRDSLRDVIHELVENCFTHSAPKDDLFGVACAQAWPQGELAQVAIADPGVGIRATLEQNPDYQGELERGNACEIATRYGVSGKTYLGHHSGYGMTLARDAVTANGGTFVVVSQGEMVVHTSSATYPLHTGPGWAGTLVVIEWRLDRPLSVRDVYQSWPTPEGFSDDDFDF